VPSGAKTVDAAGASVYPGLIDTSTDIGLNEPGVRNYDDVSEILPFGQMLRTRVAVQADSDAIPVARVEGITTVAVRPSGGTISGEIPVMNLGGWTWEEMILRPAAGLALTLPGGGGGGGRGGGGGGGGAAANTGGADPLTELNRLLARARLYAKQGPNRQVDWTLEPLVPIVERRQAMYVAAGTDVAIRSAVAWAEREGVRIVVRSGADAQLAADFLKQHDVPLILSDILTLPSREDAFHAYTYQAPGVLAKAGVTFAFSSGGYQFSRNLAFQAGRAVAWGLDRDAALKALTINAAKILGVDHQVGSIEAGKVANLIVVKGDPLEIRSQITHVVVAGNDLPLTSKHVELFNRFMSRQ
jgi:imidazolonepropionase-like amidohydrolase